MGLAAYDIVRSGPRFSNGQHNPVTNLFDTKKAKR